MTRPADIGIAGLGAMGRNLALQAIEAGLDIAVHDGWAEARAGWDKESPQSAPAEADVCSFAAALSRPRRILLLIKAGRPTDDFLEALTPHLEPGDIVADLGNAHYLYTQARQRRLAQAGIHLLGIGISGGAEGARRGASFMAGGDRRAWDLLAPAIRPLAAVADGEPCSRWFGLGGAGHFVKMVHNGIEYAEMQALAEVYMALRDACGLATPDIAERFGAWNRGLGESFLTGLTARVLRAPDPDGGWLIDRVLDEAGQKGTGRWTIEAALELGVPVPTLSEAVFARGLSALVEERKAAANILAGPDRSATIAADALGEALLATRICAFAQGFALLRAASEAFHWDIDLAGVAEVWRAGCILRGAVLDPIAAAFRAREAPADLIAAPYFAQRFAQAHQPWRAALAACQGAGIPVPATASALAYHDGWRSARLGANLIAAQRDAFGAHGFRRIDRDGDFHSGWHSDRDAGPGET